MGSRRVLSQRRLVLQKVEISSLFQYRVVVKNHYTEAQTVVFNINDGDEGSPLQQKKMRIIFLQLFKKTKPMKKLDLRYGSFSNENSRIVKCMKRHSRVKELIIPFSFPDDLQKTLKLCIYWIKHAKLLKKLDCVNPIDFEGRFSRHTDLLYRNFIKYLKGSRLMSFKISNTRPIVSSMPREIQQFHQYPSMLGRLKFKMRPIGRKCSSEPLIFSPLQNLYCLSISLPPLTELWNRTLDSIAQLPNLKFLKLDFPVLLNKNITMPGFFLQNLRELEGICLKFTILPKNTKELLQRLSENKKIKIFTFRDYSPANLDLTDLLACFKNWNNMERLKLDIYYDWSTQLGTEFMSSFPESILHWKSLRILKLRLSGKVDESG